MSNHVVLDDTVTATAAVVRGVEPEQLTAPTPCTDWDVRTLTNHLLQVAHALSLAGNGKPVPGDLWAQDLMTDAWADRFDESARAATAAWARPEAWEGTLDLGGMQMPAAAVASMLGTDLAVHGWDLAKATGQDYRPAEDVAEEAHGFLTQMGEQGREMGIFDTPVTAAEDASTFDRALAMSGRDPHWKP